jgi:hypothetical protein
MKQQQKVIVLIVLVAVAVLVWTYSWRQKTSNSQPALLQDPKLLAVENPSIRWGELRDAQGTEYKSNGRNPFSTIKPPTPAEIKKQQDDEAKLRAAAPPPVPIEPPKPTTASLPPNIKYFGYGTVPAGSPRRAFFVDGDDVYIVREGDTLLGRYRILKVGNTNLEFQEISSGLHGTAVLEEPASSAPAA